MNIEIAKAPIDLLLCQVHILLHHFLGERNGVARRMQIAILEQVVAFDHFFPMNSQNRIYFPLTNGHDGIHQRRTEPKFIPDTSKRGTKIQKFILSTLII